MKLKFAVGAIAAIIAMGCGGVAQSQQTSPRTRPASRGSGQTKTVEIIDPFFGQRAFTMTIPADWKFEGTILRGPNGAGQPDIVFRASSPDGLTGAQEFPRYDWGGKAMKSMPAGEFVKKVVIPEARPGAQVGVGVPIPEMSEKVAEQDRKTNEQSAAMAASFHMPPSRVSSNAERVRIEYDFNGHAEEEWIAAVASTQEFPGMSTMPGHSTSQAWATGGRAPKGQLDASEKLLIAIFKSLTPDPAWSQKQQAFAMKQNQMQMARIQQQGQAFQAQLMKQNQAFRASQQAKFEASMNSARAMSEAGHRSAMATAEHMGDVQSVIDPATGRTGQVSNQYNYSYADQNGRVVQTNSPTFHPNAQLRGNWTQLQPVQPR